MNGARKQVERLLTVLGPGAYAQLGYYFQTLTAVFRLLTTEKRWKSLRLEPSQDPTTDILLNYDDEECEHIQVKSTTGHFTGAGVRESIESLRNAAADRTQGFAKRRVVLVLVGEVNRDVRQLADEQNKTGNYLIESRGNSDPLQSFEALCHVLDCYLRETKQVKASPQVREALARLILSEINFATYTGGEFTPEGFDEHLDHWLRNALRETDSPIHDLGHLRARGPSRFSGRGTELQEISDCWTDPNTTIVHVHAGPGCGKSALIIEWIRRLYQSGSLSGCSAIGWSFYNQDEHSYRNDSDVWFAAAKRHFQMKEGTFALDTPEGLGAAIAASHIAQGGLIVLDGLETVLNPFPPDRGEIRLDQPALRTMFADLVLRGAENTRKAPRLLVVTTRIPLKILEKDSPHIRSIPLGRLTPHDGSQLLANFRIPNGRAKRLFPSEDFGPVTDELNGHPLSLCLLAAHLLTKHEGNLAMRRDLGSFTGRPGYSPQSQEDDVRHAARILDDLTRFLATNSDIRKAALGALRLIALVGRPISLQTIKSIAGKTHVLGITDTFDRVELEDAIGELKALGLISESEESRYSTHPIIGLEVRKRLQVEMAASWERMSLRLHDYYLAAGLKTARVQAPEGGITPRAKDDYDKLYLAVVHGCHAGMFDKMFCDVYREHVTDGDWGTATRSYGFFRLQFEVLRCFFQRSDEPLPQIPLLSNPRDQIILLREVGFCLWKLGQINDAVDYLQSALGRTTALADEEDGVGDRRDRSKSENITIIGRNLTNLLIDQGRFAEAITVWNGKMSFADNPPNGFMSFGVRCSLGICDVYLGKLEEAARLFREAVEKAHASKWKRLLGLPLCHYCEFLVASGKEAEAIAQLEEELASKPTRANAGLAHLALAGAYCRRAEADKESAAKALKEAEAAIEDLMASGRRDTLPDAYIVKSLALVRNETAGGMAEAKASITTAKELAEQMKAVRSHAWACVVENLVNCSDLGENPPAPQVDHWRKNWMACKDAIQAMGYISLDPLLKQCSALLDRAESR